MRAPVYQSPSHISIPLHHAHSSRLNSLILTHISPDSKIYLSSWRVDRWTTKLLNSWWSVQPFQRLQTQIATTTSTKVCSYTHASCPRLRRISSPNTFFLSIRLAFRKSWQKNTTSYKDSRHLRGSQQKDEPKQCLKCFQNVQSRLESSAKYRNSELFGHDLEFSTMNQLSWINSVTDEMLLVLIYNWHWHWSVWRCATFERIFWDAWHAFRKQQWVSPRGWDDEKHHIGWIKVHTIEKEGGWYASILDGWMNKVPNCIGGLRWSFFMVGGHL